jgi:hypothetical protein
MLYSEHQHRIAGRPPKQLSYMDHLLLMHRRADGAYCGKFKPIDRCYNSAHLKARQQGLIKAGPIKIALAKGPSNYIWWLTDKGQKAAEEAWVRQQKYNENLAAWGEKVREARKLWKQQREEQHDG